MTHYNSLCGQTICITGGLTSFTRQEAISTIRDLGGRVTKKVSRQTDILIVAKASEHLAHPSEKMVKAQQYGTSIMTEKEFMNLVRQAN